MSIPNDPTELHMDGDLDMIVEDYVWLAKQLIEPQIISTLVVRASGSNWPALTFAALVRTYLEGRAAQCGTVLR